MIFTTVDYSLGHFLAQVFGASAMYMAAIVIAVLIALLAWVTIRDKLITFHNSEVNPNVRTPYEPPSVR
ncbi:MAG: hypothetical protein KJ065_26815 [Anaerolineae bacterium]|nr:hypothetical protein [Anaerolineae bacterium]